MLTSVYLSQAARGWAYTFIYQMIDDSPDAYGLFTNTTPPTPKLAATYIHNLTSILADTSSAFTPTPITYSVANNPVTGHSLLIQKSNGTYELVVWGEAFRSQTSTNVTVNLDTPRTGRVYDVTAGTTPVSSFSAQQAIPLILNDHALIVEFN